MLWRRADIKEPLFTADEVIAWDDGIEDNLTRTGLIRRVENALSVSCDACADGHVEEVTFIESPPGSSLRAYIHCPENGRVRVPLERLRQWGIDFNGLASSITSVLSLTGSSGEIVHGRIWFLGKAVLGESPRELYLARGLTWTDAPQVLKKAVRLNTPYAVIFVPGIAPPDEIWQGDKPVVVEIRVVTSVKEQRLSVDIAHLETILSARVNKAKASQYHCRTVTHEGAKQLTKKQYEKLISEKKFYDIFIDGFTKEITHKGKAHSKLTAAEFEIICEYIESKTALRPYSTKTGNARPRDAAIKLFENARSKVDIKLGRYKYRAFQLHKVTDPKMKSFQFAPPEDMTYCLIIPNQQ
jgi:hypothetical protein